MELRPLKQQLEEFSESNRAQIESNVKREYEINKLKKQVVDLENDNDRISADNKDLETKVTNLTSQNQILIQQIKNFEKESFEIQTRIQRGREVEDENKNNG